MTSATGHRPYTGKRVFDLAILVAVALPAVVIGGVVAAAVRLSSGRPVFFRQTRVGLDGRPFEVIKFRTMIEAPEGNPIFPDPDRITRVGHLLRRFSLDELPQLINVYRGEMSVVGPRPTLPYQVERYDTRQRLRLAVRPGLTGLAQVSGRNAMYWSDRIDLDIRYVERQSPALDLAIIMRTLAAVLRRSGVDDHPSDDPLAQVDE